MAIINLRDYYPFYTSDCFMEVSDEVAEMFKEFERRLLTGCVHTAIKPTIPLIGMMGWSMRLSLLHFRPMNCTSGKLPCRSFTLLLPACRTNRQNGFTPTSFLA